MRSAAGPAPGKPRWTARRDSGARPLVWADLVPYLLARGPGTLNLASGNPMVQGEIVAALRERYAQVIRDDAFARAVYRYEDPAGTVELRAVLASSFSERLGAALTADNVLVTPGSQAAFHHLSELARQARLRLHFPNGPEYPGYRTHPDPLYTMARPAIRPTAARGFTYAPDGDAALLPPRTGFVVLSSPANPTGRVTRSEELAALAEACAAGDAFLVLDTAYAPPVPDIAFGEVPVPWTERTIVVGSLSKAGLAGERLGFVVGPVALVRRLVALQQRTTILAPRLVQLVAAGMLASGTYADLARRVIRPAYAQRHEAARAALRRHLEGVPHRVFDAGGSPFLWLWLEELPVSTDALFAELLDHDLVVAPSSVFYLPALRRWRHAHACLRLGLTESVETLERGAAVLGDVVRRLHARGGERDR